VKLRLTACLLSCLGSIQSAAYAKDVSVCTDLGRFDIELFEEEAPKHVANFLDYVNQGFYSDTVFHRVIAGFVVQGGGFDRDLLKKQTAAAIENESFNGRSNNRGTISAARTSDPHSATSQFYINLKHNDSLDADENWGYTVFGTVTRGMDVVDAIASLPTGALGSFRSDVTQPLIGVTGMTSVTDHANQVAEENLSHLPEEAHHETIKDEIEAAQRDGDLEVASDWFLQYRIACGPMEPDMLFSEAENAIALGRPNTAKLALEDFFRVSDSRQKNYESARAVYREHFPQVAQEIELPQVTNRCTAPDRLPVVPEGGNSTLDVMAQTQTAIKTYVETSNVYVECLSEILDGEELGEEQYRTVLNKHNQTIDAMQNIEENWNSQVRAFRQNQ